MDYYRLTCTDEQFNKCKFITEKSKIYKTVGLTTVGVFILVAVLRKLGFHLEDVCSIAPDILMVLVFAGLCYWAVGSIFIASERTRMRESYVAYDGNTITYHMLKSRDSVRRFTQVYHTYYITGITNIVEGAYYYTVYGDIMLTITRNAHEESKQVREVKIPRYFEGLDRVLGDFYKICR